METTEDAAIVWENPNTPITTLDFILHDGIRFVRPYFFEFIAHVKERWDMKTVTNLFAEEFRQRPLEYYIEAVDVGRILVNGKKVTRDHVVRASQTLSHFVHRHEPPVMGETVEILELTTDVVTVWKPSSVPVHACGQYRKNTVLGILEAEYNLRPLYPIHRLDRLVSGLLILARNAHTADQFRQEIEGGKISKSYIAKVKGVFPAEEVTLNASVVYDAREGRSMVKVTNKLGSKYPVGGALHQTNEKSVGAAKDACTKFKRLSSNGEYSIVQCMPLTGRTHQIRVHLQHLGHPIANDDLYASHNPPKRTETGTNAERAARLEVTTAPSESSLKRRRISEDSLSTVKEDSSHCVSMAEDRLSSDDNVEDAEESALSQKAKPDNVFMAGNEVNFVVDSLCTHCPNLWPSGYEGKEHGLWLHCKSYSSDRWSYECPLPSWAKESL
ncbi:hypothetical protein GOP47_0008749 [Adiantum capillus-veneris]|uniref:Pseudouridine synthase RsuA/RluA-like domain-containing protein n=1 Tax=Adiantum capillus-veneris TaxID=13818 RepID=A0A9D4UZ62_ADICA|nr:hypothetical protein GOP47_0008749 [Adiantum capillus-veneris]